MAKEDCWWKLQHCSQEFPLDAQEKSWEEPDVENRSHHLTLTQSRRAFLKILFFCYFSLMVFLLNHNFGLRTPLGGHFSPASDIGPSNIIKETILLNIDQF